ERTVLQRLSVFAGAFPLAAAAGVAGEGASTPDIADTVATLVAKSLATADVGGGEPLFPLLEFTRLYARERLSRSGETERFRRRHAEYHRDLLERVEAEWGLEPADFRPSAGAGAHYLILDEVRTALDWTFSTGDRSIGVALTVFATPLWLELSLLTETRERTQQALSSIEPASPDQWAIIKLQAGFGACLFFTTDRSAFALASWSKPPEARDDADRQLSALWRLWNYRSLSCEFRSALAMAWRYREVAASKDAAKDVALAGRYIGTTLYYLGELVEAKGH